MDAVHELIQKMADDSLVIGHRNSEWTGLGPVLEEDIAFSSIAQDKIGHSFQLFSILSEETGNTTPDQLAFFREAKEFKNSQFVELPIGAYEFSLIRHFLFDHAEHIRYSMLAESSNESLANLSRKIKGEIKYHVMHADTWIVQLGSGSKEGKNRLQAALDYAYEIAYSMFEPSVYEAELINSSVWKGEQELEKRWENVISGPLNDAGLSIPKISDKTKYYGGRIGTHTEHLTPLVTEMGEVIQTDANARW